MPWQLTSELAGAGETTETDIAKETGSRGGQSRKSVIRYGQGRGNATVQLPDPGLFLERGAHCLNLYQSVLSRPWVQQKSGGKFGRLLLNNDFLSIIVIIALPGASTGI